jgi:hypothetical protein
VACCYEGGCVPSLGRGRLLAIAARHYHPAMGWCTHEPIATASRLCPDHLPSAIPLGGWGHRGGPGNSQARSLVPILGIHPEGELRTFCVLHKGGLLHNMMCTTHAMDPLLFVVAPMQ